MTSQALSLQIATPFAGVGQLVWQSPQRAGSEVVSTQADGHSASGHWVGQAVSPSAQLSVHLPSQTCPAAHTVVQSPQWYGSVIVSTQAEPQRTKPSAQVKSQPVAVQMGMPLAGASQISPQPPQLFGSLLVSVQVFPHFDSGSAQVKSQTPSLQLGMLPVGLGQALPHAPQCCVLLARVTQAPPQFSRPASHVSEQSPREQTRPAVQALVQLPQRDGSLWMSTHSPSPQSWKPSWQVMPQTPSTQVAMPPPTLAQRVPHDPQLFRSVYRSTQMSSQRKSSPWHLKPHSLLSQVGSAPPGAVQTAPQPPQFSGSSSSFLQPSAQVVSPVSQSTDASSTQIPSTQV